MPKMLSPEEAANMRKRKLSDAKLVKEGAEYKVDGSDGRKRLEVTDDQREEAEEMMEEDFSEKQSAARLETALSMVEQKIGKKLPSDKKELLKNFDKLVPKELEKVLVAGKTKSTDKEARLFQYSRESIKKEIEKELFGGNLDNIEDRFNHDLVDAETRLDQLKNEKDEYDTDVGYGRDVYEADANCERLREAIAALESGDFKKALSEIKMQIFTNDQVIKEIDKDHQKQKYLNAKREKKYLEGCAKRLNVEGAQQKPISDEEIFNYCDEQEDYYRKTDPEGETGGQEFNAQLKKDIAEGNFSEAITDLDNEAKGIQGLIDMAKGFGPDSFSGDDNIKNIEIGSAKVLLTKKFGEKWPSEAKRYIQDVIKYRDTLIDKYKL